MMYGLESPVTGRTPVRSRCRRAVASVGKCVVYHFQLLP